VSDAAAIDAALLATPAEDLVALTAALIAVPSVSRNETRLADLVEARLRARAGTGALEITRLRNNVIARTNLGLERRVLIGGHLDTVPANGNEEPRVVGSELFGLGAADMKGGLATKLRLAEEITAAPDRLRLDVTLVFYEGEEIAEEFNGLRHVLAVAPELLEADLAILMEPTDGWVEAGCQGTTHVRAVYRGGRAHSARPWTGVNAIHRASDALARVVAAAEALPPVVVDGLEFRQALQVVAMAGGVANNVVPDAASITVNRRFAPSLSTEDIRVELRTLFSDADEIEVLNESPGALPNLNNPLVAEFIGVLDLAVQPKLGWTDVARFSALGIPALNFGPGDPLLAHTANEHVTHASLEGVHERLVAFLFV
jgi:succinyl-diaminopimelate desuccinylase